MGASGDLLRDFEVLLDDLDDRRSVTTTSIGDCL